MELAETAETDRDTTDTAIYDYNFRWMHEGHDEGCG